MVVITTGNLSATTEHESIDGQSTPASARPNIILILADDLGVMDVCGYARRVVENPALECRHQTPNIDALASESVVFTRAYATPLCSPSRASLLTGVNGAKLGFNNAFGYRRFKGSYYQSQLPVDEGYDKHDTVLRRHAAPNRAFINGSSSSALAPNGATPSLPALLPDYRSGFIGKWHVGGGIPGYQPADHGFEEIAYLDEGFSFYFDWAKSWDVAGDITQTYLTDNITAQATAWIEAQAKTTQPFFLLVSHFAVHTPLQAIDRDSPARPPLEGSDSQLYSAMVASLDDSVGAIMDTLDSQGLRDNTLVIVVSDNGALETRNGNAITSNAPFKGQKGSVYEGGIRVPLLLYWSDNFGSEHSTIRTSVDLTDLLPTIVSSAGYDIAPYEAYGGGQSLLGLIDSRSTAGNYAKSHFIYDPFYRGELVAGDALSSVPKSVVLNGNHKLIAYHHGQVHLFDLNSDPYESTDISTENTELTKKLLSELRQWEDTIPQRYRSRPNPRFNEESPSPFPPLVGPVHGQ
ncbi:sulfatase [Halioglobus pacificus]|uniref:Sulfatase n=2 Tax=Parahalioglobus pacificus TaxID=930806 RepID=A0A918XHC2_9GAMM|nr:sulfatase [Halioglobus pacificus]